MGNENPAIRADNTNRLLILTMGTVVACCALALIKCCEYENVTAQHAADAGVKLIRDGAPADHAVSIYLTHPNGAERDPYR